jgi:type III secretion protein Q
MNARIKPNVPAASPLRERLPSMSADDAARLRRLGSRRRRFALAQIDRNAWVEISGPHRDAAPWVVLGAGDARLATALGEDLGGDASDLHWSDYEGDSRLVAWSLAHERALAWLGEVLGSRLLPIEIVDAEPVDGGVTIGVRLGDDDGIACAGSLRISADALDRLLADERGTDAIGDAAARSAAHVATPLAVTLAGPELSIDELRELRPGDVVVAGSRRRALEDIRVDDGARAWRARWDNETLHMIEAGAATRGPQRRGSMNATHEEVAEAAPAGVGSIPVRIEFAIGEITLPFGELERIEPGYVFEVGRAIDGASVDIRANGRRIGRGQIVAIGDTLGVRITDCGADGLQ